MFDRQRQAAKQSIERHTLLVVPPANMVLYSLLFVPLGLGGFALIVATGQTDWWLRCLPTLGLLAGLTWLDIREAGYIMILLAVVFLAIGLVGGYVTGKFSMAALSTWVWTGWAAAEYLLADRTDV